MSNGTSWILELLQNLIIQTGLLAGCTLCAKRVLIDHTMTVGDFVLYLTYITQLYEPLNGFGGYYKTVQVLMKLISEKRKICILFSLWIWIN